MRAVRVAMGAMGMMVPAGMVIVGVGQTVRAGAVLVVTEVREGMVYRLRRPLLAPARTSNLSGTTAQV